VATVRREHPGARLDDEAGEWPDRRAGDAARPAAARADFDLDGTGVGAAAWAEFTTVDADRWRDEADDIERFFARFGSRLQEALPRQLARLREGLRAPAPVAEHWTEVSRGAA
jgi:hypothetical protein